MNHKLTMKTVLLFMIALLATQAQAQGWVKKYSPDLMMSPSSLYVTADSNFLVTGWNAYGPNFRTMKIGANGDAIGAFENDSITGPHFSNITQDGGLVISGPIGGNYRKIMRINTAGQKVWERSLPTTPSGSEISNTSIDTTSDNGFVVTYSHFDSTIMKRQLFIIRLNGAGQTQWTKTYLDTVAFKYPQDVCNAGDGGFICTISHGNGMNVQYTLIKVDANGNLLWEYLAPFQHYLIPAIAKDGNILLTSTHIYNKQNNLVKINNSNGNVLWSHAYDIPVDSSTWSNGLIERDDHNIVMVGTSSSNGLYRSAFWIVDTSGNTLLYKELPAANLGHNVQMLGSGKKAFTSTPDGGYAIAGWLQNDPNDYTAYIMKMDEDGDVYPSVLIGNTYYDDNENCIKNSNEPYLNPVLITFTSANDTFTVATRDSGYYSLGLEHENYTINIAPPSPYWGGSSCNAANVFIPQGTTDSVLLFGVKPLVYSPFVTISGHIDRLRACEPSIYTAKYCNTGTAPFTGVLVIEVDSLLQVDSASATIISVNGNTYYFAVPALGVMECATLKIYGTVNCDPAYTGYTTCVDAHAIQDTVINASPLWDESNLEMFVVQTSADTITFTLKNKGNGDMLNPEGLIVIEDNVILMEEPISLPAGAEHIFKVPANGSTWRATIHQTDFNPYSAFTTAAIEGAGTNSQGEVSLGYYMEYPFNGYYGYHYEACAEIRNSYDPNEKLVTPTGSGPDHLVDNDADLEYTLYFQNTGNDTAYQIRLTDTLERFLNPATIVAGASSHPYIMEIIGHNLLQFTFVNINLPDSGANQAGSNGFVKFRIKQKAGNTVGTVINNSVNIFFDYNPPVATNTATVRIGKYVITDIQSVYAEKEVRVNAFPNPFINSTRIEIQGENFSSLQLNVYDLNGRLVAQQNAQNTNSFTVQKADLTNGSYIFEISSQGKPVAKGKLIAQ